LPWVTAPVAIFSENAAKEKPMKLLVPVDGSPASLRAVKLAVDFVAGRQQSNIILLNVQNPAMPGLVERAGIMLAAWVEEEERSASEEALKEAVAACRAAGVLFTARCERGAPAATIDRIAREEKVDGIVMGTRGLGVLRGLLLGSVATQVLHLVDVPVTLVKLTDNRAMEGQMASQITCITKPHPHNDHEAITNVGGAAFYITRQECANNIDSGRETYFVHVGAFRTEVTTYVKNGVKYIRTRADSTQKDNLLSLPQCRR
jgi:nucleotide-binding universal stress UspA family protein